MDKQKHNEIIIEQFSKQAQTYTSVKAHADALDILIHLSEVSVSDTVLDVACGSGIVACEFAKYANHVTGVDITENMLRQAEKLQTSNNLTNIKWMQGDVFPLKFNDSSFSIVVTRFSFHHFVDYEKVFSEMIRVCKTGGMIMVVDVAIPKEKVKVYDYMEKLRDCSHAGVLTPEQFEKLFQSKKLRNIKTSYYDLIIDMETQLAVSFPNESDIEELRSIIINDEGINNLGIQVTKKNEIYKLFYPIHIYMGRKR